MSVTDVLRRMLDERGVDWWTSNDCALENSATHWKTGSIHWAAFEFEDEENLWLNCVATTDLTPEQAIEATLGRGECNAVYKPDGVVCSECGGGGLTVPRLGVKALRNFCPNCGRKIIK